jgi:hypothetical protein
MGLGQFFTSKNCEKFNFEDKNIEKYTLFKKLSSYSRNFFFNIFMIQIAALA